MARYKIRHYPSFSTKPIYSYASRYNSLAASGLQDE